MENKDKMRYLNVILLVGFVSLAVFGAFGMHAFTKDHETGCIVATSQAADCPAEINPIESFSLHANVFKNFSDAVFGKAGFSVLAFYLLSALGLLFGLYVPKFLKPKFSIVCRQTNSDSFSPPSKYEFNRWLALHENSPSNP